MKAMILAAGRGERMRPLTDTVPKALLAVGGKPLIAWHIEKLAAAGFSEIVINHAHLGGQIENALGNGSSFGTHIEYSHEACALETAGGIAYALPRLDAAAFAVINADVYSDYSYTRLAAALGRLVAQEALAHLVLVDNPEHHPHGDFALCASQVAADGTRLTFSGIAAYRREMFDDVARGTRVALAPLLREQIARQRVVGEHFTGRWRDIGTPQRLAMLNRELGIS